MLNATQIDQKKLYLIYEEWPEHFSKAGKIKVGLDHDPDYYNSLVMCGMGASGTCCDVLSDIMSHSSRMRSTVVKGQSLPPWVDKRSLVIANSVSGNTQETLGMMEEATSRGAEVICISSGGKLAERAAKGGHRHISIPNLCVPRASLPYLLMPGLRIINFFMEGLLENEINSVHTKLAEVSKKISINVPYDLNISKQLSSFLEFSLPVCFSSPELISAATRFKDSLNENAKLHCVRESVLEASHNEIVPFTYDNGFAPKVLLLEWASDSNTVKERFRKVSALFTKIGRPYMKIEAGEASMVQAIVSSMYVLDYSTIYMALSRMIDPSPTPAIDILKEN